MKKLLATAAALVTAGLLTGPLTGLAGAAEGTGGAGATRVSTLSDCLDAHHVCVASDARKALSVSQQDKLEQQIGSDPIYIVVAASGNGGYNAAMDDIIGDLNGHDEFVVGFWDVRLNHFGADNQGLLPDGKAASIATTAVQDHPSAPDAALTEFVTKVKQQEGSSSGGSGSSSAWIPIVIVIGVLLIIGLLIGMFIVRPRRAKRARQLKDAKAAAQDDLLALNQQITDLDSNVAIQRNPEAAAEQAAALAAYERGTEALDAARKPTDMQAVSRNIAEAQYRLASAEALAQGQPRPERRPSCFFDPRHGMSVADAPWTPPEGGPTRDVPVCAMDLHKIEQGIEPEMRRVEQTGSPQPVYYANSGFAPAYWGGYGLGPGLFTGFLLGSALSGPGWGYGWGPGWGWGEPGWDGGPGNGQDFGGGDFNGGGDFGGGDFGGGGGDFGGGGF
ncbi:MAG TPA: hypothetical protein VE864_01095 [Streptosporangiaceae bacterium]|nr:hypothetical protein [Streptosporangiaceae bacterium]